MLPGMIPRSPLPAFTAPLRAKYLRAVMLLVLNVIVMAVDRLDSSRKRRQFAGIARGCNDILHHYFAI